MLSAAVVDNGWSATWAEQHKFPAGHGIEKQGTLLSRSGLPDHSQAGAGGTADAGSTGAESAAGIESA